MYDTVEGHVAAGRITVPQRTTADDLLAAATWLDAYESDPDEDGNVRSLAAVALYLRKEAERREARNAATPRKPPPTG